MDLGKRTCWGEGKQGEEEGGETALGMQYEKNKLRKKVINLRIEKDMEITGRSRRI